MIVQHIQATRRKVQIPEILSFSHVDVCVRESMFALLFVAIVQQHGPCRRHQAKLMNVIDCTQTNNTMLFANSLVS